MSKVKVGVGDANTERWQEREARWASMLAEVENLPVIEVFQRAMAAVSRNDGGHRCRSCWDCAYVTQYLSAIGGARSSRVLH